MLVKTPDGEWLEMNVSETEMDGDICAFVTVRKGGHIQRITNTVCSSRMIAYELLCDVAKELRSGVSVIGTSNGQPVLTSGVYSIEMEQV